MLVPGLFLKNRVVVFASLAPTLRMVKAAGASPGQKKEQEQHPAKMEGDRWITLSPNGKDQDPKIPVLIRQRPGAENTWTVVGGSGGQRMRGFELHDVASKEEWEARAKERRGKKEAATKERQAELLKKPGGAEQIAREAAAVEHERDEQMRVQREFIASVAPVLGWTDWDKIPAEWRDKPEGVQKELIRKQHNILYGQAKSAVEEAQVRYIRSAEVQREVAAQLADDEPLAGEPDKLPGDILNELSRIKPGLGTGYEAQRKKRLVEQYGEEVSTESIESKRAEAEARLQESREIAIAAPAAAMLMEHSYGKIRRLMTEAQEALASGDEGQAAELLAEREGELRRMEQRVERAEGNPLKAAATLAMIGRLRDFQEAVAAVDQQYDITGRAKHLETAVHESNQVATLLRADRKLRVAEKRLRRQKAEAEAAEHEVEGHLPLLENELIPNPVRLDDTPDADADAMWEADMQERMATSLFRDFVATAMAGEVEAGGETLREQVEWDVEQFARALQPHVHEGAYVSLSAAMQHLTGSEVVDRDAIDVLGTERTAEMMAWWLQQHLSPEKHAQALAALQEFHHERVRGLTEGAMKDARALLAEADHLRLPEGETPADLMTAKQQNDMRMTYLRDAVAVIGRHYGDVHIIGQLIGEMQKKRKAGHVLRVDMGDRGAGDVVGRARGLLGLQPGDFELEADKGRQAMLISPQGMDRICSQFTPPQGMALADALDSLKKGQEDEENWIPKGMVSRSPDSFRPVDDPELIYTTPRLGDIPGGEREDALREYIGVLALANNGDAQGVRSFLQRPDVQANLGVTPGDQDFQKTLSRLLPVAASNKGRGVEDADRIAEATVADAVKRKTGSRLSKQSLPVSDLAGQKKVAEAIHRCLAVQPAFRLAFTPAGEVVGRERQEVQEAWQKETGTDEAGWAKMAAEMADQPGGAMAAALDTLRGAFVKAYAKEHERVAGDKLGLVRIPSTGGGRVESLGPRADAQLRGILPHVAHHFATGQPADLFPGFTMSKTAAGDFRTQQRMVKAIIRQKRLGLWAGAGSGKTVISYGAFTQLRADSKVKRGLFVVPVSVLGQFSSEASRFIEPGSLRWSADMRATQKQRMASYAHPDTHMVVVTHTQLRDDMTAALAADRGISKAKAAALLNSGTRADRKALVAEVCKGRGWNFEYMYVDEAHRLSNRKGKEDSWLANVSDAMGDQSEYMTLGTGTPVKNDASELYDMLSKLDAGRFTDRDEFLRRYGGDSQAARSALQRLTRQYFYSEKVSSGQPVTRHTERVQLSTWQREQQATVMSAFARCQQAQDDGRVDVDAARRLSPNSFRGITDPKQVQDRAARIQRSAGVVKEAALRRVVLDAPPEHSAKLQRATAMAAERVKAGKAGVIFSSSLQSLRVMRAHLEKQGLRVRVIEGPMDAETRETNKVAFNDGKVDVLLCSNAAAEGVNLQKKGQWMFHFDVPVTAMAHKQRSARIDRVGQKRPVEVVDFVADDCPYEARGVRRLGRKWKVGDTAEMPTDFDEHNLSYHLSQASLQSPGGNRGKKQEQAGSSRGGKTGAAASGKAATGAT